jgi:hypothetical protein
MHESRVWLSKHKGVSGYVDSKGTELLELRAFNLRLAPWALDCDVCGKPLGSTLACAVCVL